MKYFTRINFAKVTGLFQNKKLKTLQMNFAGFKMICSGLSV